MSEPIRSYEDLEAWQYGMLACECVYRTTAAFPRDERFGLISQLRRAAVAVPSNIAEGWGRGSTQDYLRFLRVARGSLYELETQLELARRLGYIDDQKRDEAVAAVRRCGRILAGLIKSIEVKTRA